MGLHSWPCLTAHLEATFWLNPNYTEVLKNKTLIATCNCLFSELPSLVSDPACVCVVSEESLRRRCKAEAQYLPASKQICATCTECVTIITYLCAIYTDLWKDFPFVRADLHENSHWDHAAIAASSSGCLTLCAVYLRVAPLDSFPWQQEPVSSPLVLSLDQQLSFRSYKTC